MSYYGDGRVIQRLRRPRPQPAATRGAGCPHLYFTGCAGNVAAGKYNDGAPERRSELADRIHHAMVEAERIRDPSRVETLVVEFATCPPAAPLRHD